MKHCDLSCFVQRSATLTVNCQILPFLKIKMSVSSNLTCDDFQPLPYKKRGRKANKNLSDTYNQKTEELNSDLDVEVCLR